MESRWVIFIYKGVVILLFRFPNKKRLKRQKKFEGVILPAQIKITT
jgi:hypothetical protein